MCKNEKSCGSLVDNSCVAGSRTLEIPEHLKLRLLSTRPVTLFILAPKADLLGCIQDMACQCIHSIILNIQILIWLWVRKSGPLVAVLQTSFSLGLSAPGSSKFHSIQALTIGVLLLLWAGPLDWTWNRHSSAFALAGPISSPCTHVYKLWQCSDARHVVLFWLSI